MRAFEAAESRVGRKRGLIEVHQRQPTTGTAVSEKREQDGHLVHVFAPFLFWQWQVRLIVAGLSLTFLESALGWRVYVCVRVFLLLF